jgi:cell division GTPase FtsZ
MQGEKVSKTIGIIGIGNAGNQVAYLAQKKYGSLFESFYVNTSEADLSMVNVENTAGTVFKIGKDIEGSGKNRFKMKLFLKENINTMINDEHFLTKIKKLKYVFIVASTAGGTGSGSSPILLNLLKEILPRINFILVGILPTMNASLMEFGNTLEFLDELYNKLDQSETTYMIYDNDTVVNKYSPTESLEVVNNAIVEDIKILSGVDNYATPYDSIDSADMESIITTPGRLLITRINKDLTEKNLEDQSIDEFVIKCIKQSCHAETDRNKRVVRYGIITYFTTEVNKIYSSRFEKLHEFIGTPVERFNHHAINDKDEAYNFLYLIASGLSPINDKIQKIVQKVDALKKVLANDVTVKFLSEDENPSYEIMESRRRFEKTKAIKQAISKDDLFKKFLS